MRLAVFVLVVLACAPARAERRRNSLSNDICALSLVESDEGRGELVPLVSTTIGGGLDIYRSVGGVARLHFADGWVMEMEAQKRSVERRRDLPVPVLQTRRVGGGALTVGWTPFAGRFLFTDTTIVHVDLVASAGIGIEFVRTPMGAQAEERLAFVASTTLRFRIQPWLSLSIGIHDEMLPIGDPPSRTTARATDQPVTMPATTHELEVRAGLGFWIPDGPGRTCRRHCTSPR